MRPPTGAEAVAAERPSTQLWLPVAAVAAAVGLVYMAMFAVPPLITIFVDDLRLSHPQAGALMSVCLGFFLVTSVVSGRLADRYGPRRVVLAGLVLCGTASVCFPLTDSFPLFLLWRAAVGIAGGFIFAPGIAFVASLLGSRTSLGVGVLVCGLSTGTTVAFFATRFLAEALDWRWPFWIYGAAALVGTAVFGAVSGGVSAGDDRRRRDPTIPVRDVLASPPFRFVLAGLFVGMFIAYGVLTWVPPYLDEAAGFSTAQISFTSGLMTIVAIPGTLTSGWLAHRTGQPLAVAGAGLSVTLLVAVFAVSNSPSHALATAVATLCILGTAHALAPMNSIPPMLFGRAGSGTAAGLAAAAGMSGAVTSTYAGGWIVDATGGYRAVFGVYAAAAAVVSLVIIPLGVLSLRRWRTPAGTLRSTRIP